jgi:hypothetical protein
VRAVAIALVFQSGCWLALRSPSPVEEPRLEPAPQPRSDDPVGCITKETGPPRPGRRRNSSYYTIGARRVSYEDVDRALAARPASADQLALGRRDDRIALAMSLLGAAVAAGSIGGMVGWLLHDTRTETPLLMMLPASAGYATMGSATVFSIRAGERRRRAIDLYNQEAATSDRCPP